MATGDDRPLGVFDSGIGGLTVLAAIQARLPAESTIYLGDTARVPYGTKSASVVTRYALNTAAFLVGQGIKALVVACNTASAVALPALIERLDLPVIGVIEAGAARAASGGRGKRIGVIGTEGTVNSGSYERVLRALDPQVAVFQRACPLFVPLAEEGWGDHPVTRQVAAEYLDDWATGIGLDSLILGCTHYPLLVPAIREALAPDVELVDSASAVADAVAKVLEADGLARAGVRVSPRHTCYVTDVPGRFGRVGERFLGRPLPEITQVDIEVVS
jgi:glutamate racemase